MVTDGILKEILTCPVSIDKGNSDVGDNVLLTTVDDSLRMWQRQQDKLSPTSVTNIVPFDEVFFRDVNTLF